MFCPLTFCERDIGFGGPQRRGRGRVDLLRMGEVVDGGQAVEWALLLMCGKRWKADKALYSPQWEGYLISATSAKNLNFQLCFGHCLRWFAQSARPNLFL